MAMVAQHLIIRLIFQHGWDAGKRQSDNLHAQGRQCALLHLDRQA